MRRSWAGLWLSVLLLTAALCPAGAAPAQETGAPRIACAYASGGVVHVELAEGTAEACCFTVIEREPEAASPDWLPCGGAQRFSVFKSDGTYYLLSLIHI